MRRRRLGRFIIRRRIVGRRHRYKNKVRRLEAENANDIATKHRKMRRTRHAGLQDEDDEEEEEVRGEGRGLGRVREVFFLKLVFGTK
jgi:hypothetical protein